MGREGCSGDASAACVQPCNYHGRIWKELLPERQVSSGFIYQERPVKVGGGCCCWVLFVCLFLYLGGIFLAAEELRTGQQFFSCIKEGMER